VLGIIFTEIDSTARATALEAISNRTRRRLSSMLPHDQVQRLKLYFYIFPDDPVEPGKGCPGLPRDLVLGNERTRVPILLKRCLDVVGSLFALVLFAPVFVAVAMAVRMTSKGPILFRQQRVGMYGRAFTFFKFRSMYAETDHAIHEDYAKRFISGAASSNGIYKLTKDPRITPIGKLLRRTSLDELPQFFNVLQGSMSLVGPRPPIQYEVNRYHLWHKRRFLEVKPGITGLWQVTGRSKVTFDEMVRLDLQYAKSWSLWLDLKILLQTPHAVFTGGGAF
jgi:lipopolysaccharide/colanic/teichoic acid biosynthesis glycosyltransferase